MNGLMMMIIHIGKKIAPTIILNLVSITVLKKDPNIKKEKFLFEKNQYYYIIILTAQAKVLIKHYKTLFKE